VLSASVKHAINDGNKNRAPLRYRGTPAALIARLGAPAFADREAAERALRDLGPAAEPAVRAALRETSSAEARQRLEAIARGLSKPPGTNRGEVRAVEILERIARGQGPGSEVGRAAKAYLVPLAGGEPTAALTRDAARAVIRLGGGK
jgi:hypothetical protein